MPPGPRGIGNFCDTPSDVIGASAIGVAIVGGCVLDYLLLTQRYYMDTWLNGKGCDYVTTAHEARYCDYSTGFRCCADLPAAK